MLSECLTRIDQLDAELRAWVEVAPRPGLGAGSLAGIPFGVKDIFETRGLATAYGSPLYAGRRGENDAGIVSGLCERGAVLLGKTHTAAFAYFDPPPTRNPRDLTRTPGGSSSGSAAAVAAGMVPFALGTQTQGSILRPASFCGIVGWKPTFGLLSTEGVLPFAPSLDTVGLFTQTVDDLALLWPRMGQPIGEAAAERLGVIDTAVSEEMRAAVSGCVGNLKAAGWRVEDVELPRRFNLVLPAVRTVNDYEGARTHERLWREYGSRIGSKLAGLVQSGLRIPEEDYRRALDTLKEMRAAMRDVYREYPVLLSAAALGLAPPGLDSTGDPAANAPWTGLHGPALAVPMPVEDLPLGLQLTAAPGRDGLLIETAREMCHARVFRRSSDGRIQAWRRPSLDRELPGAGTTESNGLVLERKELCKAQKIARVMCKYVPPSAFPTFLQCRHKALRARRR